MRDVLEASARVQVARALSAGALFGGLLLAAALAAASGAVYWRANARGPG